MNDTPESIFDTDPRRVRELLVGGLDSNRLWGEDELDAILRHQLSTPVRLDLSGMDRFLSAKVENLAAAQGLLLRSFQDLLEHRNPPIELLVLIKQFAKRCRLSGESHIPKDVATVLYFASIAAGLARCRRKITSLGDAAVRAGFEWGIARNWVDKTTKSLLQEGLRALEQTNGTGECV